MVRWIAFDDDTAEAVVSRLRRGAAEIQHNSPVDAALHTDRPSVIVLPSSTPGRLLIAHFTPRKISPPVGEPRLGIPAFQKSVAPVAKKPVRSANKPWWRNIVAM
jgi:hypothetical protein